MHNEQFLFILHLPHAKMERTQNVKSLFAFQGKHPFYSHRISTSYFDINGM
jgi:hypothetical protein